MSERERQNLAYQEYLQQRADYNPFHGQPPPDDEYVENRYPSIPSSMQPNAMNPTPRNNAPPNQDQLEFFGTAGSPIMMAASREYDEAPITLGTGMNGTLGKVGEMIDYENQQRAQSHRQVDQYVPLRQPASSAREVKPRQEMGAE